MIKLIIFDCSWSLLAQWLHQRLLQALGSSMSLWLQADISSRNAQRVHPIQWMDLTTVQKDVRLALEQQQWELRVQCRSYCVGMVRM